MFRLMFTLFGLIFTQALRPDSPSDGEPQDSEPDTPQENPPEDKRFSQAELEHELGKRLERERSKAEREREEGERKAREKALQDGEDWKKLAEERSQSLHAKEEVIKEFETKAENSKAKDERISKLEEMLKAQMKASLESVPEIFRPFVEGMAVEKQADWLRQNADKLEGPAPTRTPNGSRPSPRPTEDRRDEGRDEQVRLAAERRARASF